MFYPFNKGWWMNVRFKVKKKHNIPINFIILKIWSFGVAQLLLKAMMYLLETFKCCNKLHTYNLCFVG